jgi:hypothetical protein
VHVGRAGGVRTSEANTDRIVVAAADRRREVELRNPPTKSRTADARSLDATE